MACYHHVFALCALLGSYAAGAIELDPRPEELSWFEPFWVAPAIPGAASEAGSVAAMLEYPEGWALGHAAAIVLPNGSEADPARDRLIAGLIEQGAAVLLLYAPRGVAADRSFATSATLPQEPEYLPAIFGALVALRRDVGAAVVIALGHGGAEVEKAALQAASETVASSYLGDAGPRFAVGAALGGLGRNAAFARGAPLPASEDWDLRVPALCNVLSAAAGDLEPDDVAEERVHTAARDCLTALLHPSRKSTAADHR